MLLGSRAIVKSRLNVSRFLFELLEYEWEAGTEVFEMHSSTVLRWRIEPRLEWPGRIGKGNAGNFGQLMLLPPDTPLRSVDPAAQAGRCQVVACHYDPAWLSETAGVSSDALSGDLCLSLVNREIDHAMRRIWFELLKPGFAAELMSETLATGIAIDLARHVGARNLTTGSGVLSRHQLERIREMVIDNGGQSPTAANLANALGISETHLRRMFKATTGQTIHGYVEQIRLEQAKLLLTTTDLPLKVVSYRLGFAHPSAFTAAFGRATGQSPKTFRRIYLVNKRG